MLTQDKLFKKLFFNGAKLFLLFSLIFTGWGPTLSEPARNLAPNTDLVPFKESNNPYANGVVISRDGVGLKVYSALSQAVTFDETAKPHLLSHFGRLKSLNLFEIINPHMEIIEAGWQSIDWDQFAKAIFDALDKIKSEIDEGTLKIEYHKRGPLMVMNPESELNGKFEPQWVQVNVTDKGRIIHISDACLKNLWFSGKKEDKELLKEILFYGALKPEIEKFLSANPKVDADMLTPVILKTLTPIAGKWWEEQNFPPSISRIEKMNIGFAFKHGWNGYLETVNVLNPFNFSGALLKTKNEYQRILAKFRDYFPNSEAVERNLNALLSSLSHVETSLFYFSLTNGFNFENDLVNKIIPHITFLKDEDKSELFSFLRTEWMTILENKAIYFEDSSIEKIFDDPFAWSDCYRYHNPDGPDFFIKVPKKPKQAEYLGMELKIIKHLMNVFENSDYHQEPLFDTGTEINANEVRDNFITFSKGIQLVNINGRVQMGLVMEHVGNSTTLYQFVKERLKNGEPLTPYEIFSIAHQIFKAFLFLKQEKIFVRDVKPRNMLIQQDPVTKEIKVKIIDFGFAHFEHEYPFPVGESVGTPFKFSKQEIEGKPYTYAEELFKIGETLYFMLTGDDFPYRDPNVKDSEVAYQGISPYKIARKIMENELVEIDPRQYKDVSLQNLAVMVNQMLQKEREDRAGDIKEVYEKLRPLFDFKPIELLLLRFSANLTQEPVNQAL